MRHQARIEPAAVTLGLAIAALAAAASVTMGAKAFAVPVGVALAAFLVWQPLALLTLFVWVGLYKNQAALEALPIDITLMLGALLSAVCLYRFACGRAQRIPFGLVAVVTVIGVMLIVSLDWTPSSAYGAQKTGKFLTLTLLATVAPFFLIEGPRDVWRFFLWAIVFALVTAGYTLANPPSAEIGRLEFGGETNTISISLLLCSAAVVLLLIGLAKRAWARWWSVVGGVALIAIAAAVGSRGPILSLLVALVVTGTAWALRVPRKVVPILAVVALGLAIVPSIPLPEAASQRLGRAVRDPLASLENDGRWALYHQAIELIEQHPLRGAGAGGFESVGRARVPEKYPHNMFLELYAELGLVAAIVMLASTVALLVGLLRRAWRHPEARGRELVYMVLGVLLLNLFCAQLSGDINENRAFWWVFGLAWLVVANPGSLGDEPGRPARLGSAASRE
jgi:O-antigen ligase